MKIIVAALSVLLTFPAFAQQSTISVEKMNILYIGVPNPVKAIIEGQSCESIVMSGEVADIKATGNCGFDVWVDKPGKLYIEIGIKENGNFKSVGKREFRIKYIPDPYVILGGRTQGRLKLDILKEQTEIVAEVVNFDFEVVFEITNFDIEISRYDKVILKENTNGSKFSQSTLKAFSDLKTGDKIAITNIHAQGPDKRDRLLTDIILIVD
jgi:hypothetical protein